MKVIARNVEILLTDESGYRFTIHALDTEQGWLGSVELHVEPGAIEYTGVLPRLLTHARQLVRMLEQEMKTLDEGRSKTGN